MSVAALTDRPMDLGGLEPAAMLEVRSLRFSYDHRPVLKGLDFRVAAGELCALLGNNGVGKSTLLKCLLGILRPQQGRVLLAGQDSAALGRRRMARRLAYVAQQSSTRERLTVFDVVLMGRRPYITSSVRDVDLDVVHEIIEKLGLQALAMRFIDELSGGEAQKVLIARALAQEPSVLVLDEPTSNLDLKNQHEVMRAIREAVEQRGIAAVMAVHDINLALRFADRFILLKDGDVFAGGGPEIITPESVRETYGVAVSVGRLNGRSIVIPEDE